MVAAMHPSVVSCCLVCCRSRYVCCLQIEERPMVCLAVRLCRMVSEPIWLAPAVEHHQRLDSHAFYIHRDMDERALGSTLGQAMGHGNLAVPFNHYTDVLNKQCGSFCQQIQQRFLVVRRGKHHLHINLDDCEENQVAKCCGGGYLTFIGRNTIPFFGYNYLINMVAWKIPHYSLWINCLAAIIMASTLVWLLIRHPRIAKYLY